MSIIGIVSWLGECGVPPLEGVVTNTHSPSCGQWCQDPGMLTACAAKHLALEHLAGGKALHTPSQQEFRRLCIVCCGVPRARLMGILTTFK